MSPFSYLLLAKQEESGHTKQQWHAVAVGFAFSRIRGRDCGQRHVQGGAEHTSSVVPGCGNKKLA